MKQSHFICSPSALPNKKKAAFPCAPSSRARDAFELQLGGESEGLQGAGMSVGGLGGETPTFLYQLKGLLTVC